MEEKSSSKTIHANMSGSIMPNISSRTNYMMPSRVPTFSQFYEPPASYHYGKEFTNERLLQYPHCVELFPGVANWKPNLREKIDKNGNGMLNSEQGGVLVFGVNDNRVVEGIELDSAMRDQVVKVVNGMLNRFDPPVDPNLYNIFFVPVVEAPAGDNVAVIEVLLKPPSYPCLFLSSSGGVFMKTDEALEGPLRMARVIEVITNRFKCTLLTELEQAQRTITGLRDRIENGSYLPLPIVNDDGFVLSARNNSADLVNQIASANVAADDLKIVKKRGQKDKKAKSDECCLLRLFRGKWKKNKSMNSNETKSADLEGLGRCRPYELSLLRQAATSQTADATPLNW